MSFRGRGRGRGRFGGGGGFGFARQEPFVEFPEIELPDRKSVKEERALVFGNAKLLSFWKSSPYYIEETSSKKSQSMDVERYSDWGKPKSTAKRDALGNFLVLHPSNFPKELVSGAKWRQTSKKVRWDPSKDVQNQKWDLFEKLEQKYQGQDEKGQKENKEEEEEDDEDLEAEDAEENFSDDDYNQNIDFDDDDDDYNDMDEGDNDEPEY